MVQLAVEFLGLRWRNPLLSASGTFGHGLEMRAFAPPEELGGLVSKTVTLAARPGNAAPRICETEAGFLNSIGLENRGIESYLAQVVPEVRGAATIIVTNIGGEAPEEFAELARRLDDEDAVDVLEINLSCPNVQGGRLPFATDPRVAERVVRGVRDATRKPLLAKLSPNVTDIAEIARAVEAGGADGITAINTLLGMSVDWRSGRPGLATIQGGYSGVALKPVALRCAWACVEAVSIPVVGCGGVRSAEDVLEFLAVGCSAVQVGTASFSDPATLPRLVREIERLLDDAGCATVADVAGRLGAYLAARAPKPAGFPS